MRLGYLSLEVLVFLKGQPWDDVARAYVYALRPSETRVSTGTIKSDARTWRVTVMMADDARIAEITQEVEVLLPPGIEHGHALACELDRRQEVKHPIAAAERQVSPPTEHPLNQAIDRMLDADRTVPADDLLAEVRSMCTKVSPADLRVAIMVHRESCHLMSCPVLDAMEQIAAKVSP